MTDATSVHGPWPEVVAVGVNEAILGNWRAGGHARTAGTATTILPIVGVTPAGPTPRRAVPPRLLGAYLRFPVTKFTASAFVCAEVNGIIATWRLRLITPHVGAWASSH
jgi:hypothetical protein